MNYFFLILYLFCYQFSDAQSMSIELELINYNNFNNNRIYVLYKLDNGEKELDSILLNNNKFIFQSPNKHPHLLTIYRDRKLIYSLSDALNFYVDNTIEKTKGHIDYSNFENSVIIGGQNQKEFELLNRRLSFLNFNDVGVELQNYYLQKKESKDSVESKFIQSKIDSLSNEFDILRQKAFDIKINFVREFPNSYVSANSLQSLLLQREGLEKIDTLQFLFNNFSPIIQKSPVGNEIVNILQNYYTSNIGAKAPNFSIKDSNGDLLNLSSQNGKYILLDFWASWCAPCIEDFPKLKSFHQKFSNEIKIIGISRDENLEKWKNAILKYDLEIWSQVSLKENNNSELIKTYFVNAIPVKVLIDPKGFIIGKWRGGGQENMKELEELLNQNLN